MTDTNTAQFDRALLDRLCAEIEIAWLERQDESAVDRLAALNPLYARSLYDFFALLIAVDLDQVRPANVRSFMEYLTQRTGEKPTSIAAKMKVPYPFLLQAQRYPQNVPERARKEIAERAAQAWQVDPGLALAALENPSQTAIAASRDAAYSDAPDYREMIRRAKMTKKEQAYWLSLT